MYGVPPDLDLSRFKDALLTQVGLGEYQVQFHFHRVGGISANACSIYVEGNWELRDSGGSVIDGSRPNAERLAYYLHVLLGKSVQAFSIDAPLSFSLTFVSGHTLTIFDSSERYESFSIQPGNIFI